MNRFYDFDEVHNGFCINETTVENYPSLTSAMEYDLWDKVEQGDKRAFDIIIKSCFKYICRKADVCHKHYRVDYDELVAVGTETLMECTRRYNRNKAVRFYTYARKYVEFAIQHAAEDMVRLDRKYSDNMRIDYLSDDSDETEDIANPSVQESLVNRIKDYLDKRYYEGAGNLFLEVMSKKSNGMNLQVAAADMRVDINYVKRMLYDVRNQFPNDYKSFRHVTVDKVPDYSRCA